jgi:polysaccharide deacetylase family protein (PEP-CTERM system associated)
MMSDQRNNNTRQHILSVVLEDYCHVTPVGRVVPRENWHRFESRVEHNTSVTLDLLDSVGAKATFFTLGWIADHQPEVIAEVVRRGHEIASKGYFHRSIRQMSPGEFREDAVQSREALERASGMSVRGYRIAHGWFSEEDLWALDVLSEEGFAYDSSVRLVGAKFKNGSFSRFTQLHSRNGAEIWEVPLSSWKFGPLHIPFSGGNYVRQFPDWLVRKAAAYWDRNSSDPMVFYFHIWELDPDQPRITAASTFGRLRQYRNLHEMPDRIYHYLSSYRFSSIADYLGLPPTPVAPIRPARPELLPVPLGLQPGATTTKATVKPISVVVPCYNEEATMGYLANTLRGFADSISDEYDISFVFVDDGSQDRTWERLNELFGDQSNCCVVRHPHNRGVAAATLTGIANAKTEIVCAIDCDGTYDPQQLRALIPMLTPGVDLVTASPYHELGEVINLSGWRLFLSKGLSNLYRLVLHCKLATYTSCFRVYRRQAVKDMTLNSEGFVGITEILCQLDMNGQGVKECPAVMEVRLLGQSKMRIFKTIFGHLSLLARLGGERWLRQNRPHYSSKTGETP